MTLYDITGEYLRLYEMADEMDVFEFEEAFVDAMESLDGEFEAKAEGYGMIIKSLEADVEVIKAEERRLADRKRVITNNVTTMKKRLQDAMVLANKPKFKTALFSFSVQKNPKKVVMDETDIGRIPLEYLSIQMPVINKGAIKDALTEGVDLSGIAHFEQDESLRIR